MICKQAKFQSVIRKPLMQCPFHSCKLNPVSTVLKNSPDTVCLFRTVTTDIKCVSPAQIIFERLCHQIEILMEDGLCRSMESQRGIRCTGWLVAKLHPPEI